MAPSFINGKPAIHPADPSWAQKRALLPPGAYTDEEATALLGGKNPIKTGSMSYEQEEKPVVKAGAGMAQKGLSLSPDALEALRAQGIKDDAIADEMSASSAHFASQLQKIRKKFGGDPAATTAFLNTRFYGDTAYSPEAPEEKKGYVGRTLDRMYSNAKGMRKALDAYNAGDINAGQAVTRIAARGFRGVVSPATEASSTVIGGALRKGKEISDATGATDYLKDVGSEIAESEVGQAVGPYVQGGIDKAKGMVEDYNNLPEGSYVRDAVELGLAGVDALDVYGTGKALQYTGKLGLQSARHPLQTLRHPVNAVNLKLGAKAAPALADDVARELTGTAKEAVKKGMDEKFMTFVADQAPDTRAVMAKMTEAANEGAGVLGGTVRHKEILGGQMMDNLAYILDEKKAVGSALSAMKGAVADDAVNLTDAYQNLLTTLRNKGAVISDKGKITSLAGAADDNIPLLQQTLEFLQPDDAGNVIRSGKQVDMWRGKMFEEMNSAKAKLAQSSAGQSAFGFAEKTTNDVRRAALVSMAKGNGNMLVLNDAYEKLSTASSKFLKSIGYKGKLSVDAITAKELRAGEVALRTLGNASADTRDAFMELIKTAREFGRVSNVDDMALIKYADALEDVFPITPTRSLQGNMSRSTRDALGNLTEDVVTGGSIKKGLTNRIAEPVMKVYDKLRGLTPENRFKLLMEVLNAPPETQFFNVMKKALPKDAVDDIGKSAVQGVDAGDMKPIAQAELNAASPAPQSPQSPQGPQAGQSRVSAPPVSQASPATVAQPVATLQSTPEVGAIANYFGKTPQEIDDFIAAHKDMPGGTIMERMSQTFGKPLNTDAADGFNANFIAKQLGKESADDLLPSQLAIAENRRLELGGTRNPQTSIAAAKIDTISDEARKSLQIADDQIRASGLTARKELQSLVKPYKEVTKQMTDLGPDYGTGERFASELMNLRNKKAFEFLPSSDLQGSIDTPEAAIDLLTKASQHHAGKPIAKSIDSLLDEVKKFQPSEASEEAFEQGLRDGFSATKAHERLLEDVDSMVQSGYVGLDDVIDENGTTLQQYVRDYEDALRLRQEKALAARAAGDVKKGGGDPQAGNRGAEGLELSGGQSVLPNQVDGVEFSGGQSQGTEITASLLERAKGFKTVDEFIQSFDEKSLEQLVDREALDLIFRLSRKTK